MASASSGKERRNKSEDWGLVRMVCYHGEVTISTSTKLNYVDNVTKAFSCHNKKAEERKFNMISINDIFA